MQAPQTRNLRVLNTQFYIALQNVNQASIEFSHTGNAQALERMNRYNKKAQWILAEMDLLKEEINKETNNGVH